MSNALYNPYKALLLTTGGINLSTDTIKVALVDTGVYTFSAAHDFYDDVSAGVVGTPQTLGSKTTTNGVFDAADVTYTAVSGNSCEAVVIYKDTGNPATSNLIAYIDTVASGLPVTPDGGDIAINWNASGIFTL